MVISFLDKSARGRLPVMLIGTPAPSGTLSKSMTTMSPAVRRLATDPAKILAMEESWRVLVSTEMGPEDTLSIPREGNSAGSNAAGALAARSNASTVIETQAHLRHRRFLSRFNM